MRRKIPHGLALALALSLLGMLPNPAFAKPVASLNWGYINVRNAVFNSSLTDLESIGTFSYLDFELGEMSEEHGILVGLGGFQVNNSLGDWEFYKLTQISAWAVGRYYLVPANANQLSRPFIEVGPSFNNQRYEILSEESTENKLGAVVGVGLIVKRLGVVRLRYAYVDKQGEIDASSIQLTFGAAWGY